MYPLINIYREDEGTDDLDRYGLYKSNRPAPVIDIFSQLDQTKPEVRNVDERAVEKTRSSAATAFLPYCLTTDPTATRKHITVQVLYYYSHRYIGSITALLVGTPLIVRVMQDDSIVGCRTLIILTDQSCVRMLIKL